MANIKENKELDVYVSQEFDTEAKENKELGKYFFPGDRHHQAAAALQPAADLNCHSLCLAMIPHCFQVSAFHLASSQMLLRVSIDCVASDCDMNIATASEFLQDHMRVQTRSPLPIP